MPADALLAPLAKAVQTCLDTENTSGKERDGSWCVESARLSLEQSLPLVGAMECRRVRFDGTTPLELMRRSLRQSDGCMNLAGGANHEFIGTPGVASAFLQVVVLPPNARFPDEAAAQPQEGTHGGSGGGGVLGWARPPLEGGGELSVDDLVYGATISATVDDVVLLERPSPGQLAWETDAAMAGGGTPEDAPELLQRLSSKVGGLDGPISTVVRRALASRLYPPALTRELGISPVRGMLLYGPPGCGKTLLAREICAALGAREPKIVNGPEMMSKYVGDSEEYIRGLFAEAELEQAEAGDGSALHVIVFDELDAFTRERGSLAGDTTGIRDSVVNQLLAKMDGVEQLDNVLIVGLTNRPELIDSALLRPGRMEVQVEVPRPDTEGRQQILMIQTRLLRDKGSLDRDAAAALRSGALAAVTKGFSGADLAGLMRSATSFALERYVDDALLKGWVPGSTAGGGAAAAEATADGLLEVTLEDMVRALREASPRGAGGGFQRKPAFESGSGKQQRASLSLRRELRGWYRETRLRVLTRKALADGDLIV